MPTTTAPIAADPALETQITDLQEYVCGQEQALRAYQYPKKPDVSGLTAADRVAKMLEYDRAVAAAEIEVGKIHDRIRTARELLAKAQREQNAATDAAEQARIREEGQKEYDRMNALREQTLAAAEAYNALARELCDCDRNLIIKARLADPSEFAGSPVALNLTPQGKLWIAHGWSWINP